MKINRLRYKVGIILLSIVLISSCEDDLTDIGSEIIGSETPNGILDDSHSVIAYSLKNNPVQTNLMPSYQLGMANHPVFGKSKAEFLTQLMMKANNPKFGEDPIVDSVFVYIPYYSQETSLDTVRTYKIDSIYGNTPINISIHESNYYLREFDPETGFKDPQLYYSDQGPLFQNHIGPEIGRVENFVPSAEGYIFRKGDSEREYLAPGLRVKLDSIFFQEKILNKEGSDELRNNTNFRNYFRGLSFKVDAPQENGNLFIFDASKAYVKIHYSILDDDDEREQKVYQLDFGGISLNTYENSALPEEVQYTLDHPDRINGNEKLYLRGGDGIMTVVELFGEDADGNGVPDELEILRAKKWLINEANLTFYVNQDMMSGPEPDRIMVYNLRTSQLLADYQLDPTNGLPPATAMNQHLGILERGSDNKGKFYKIKITNHISHVINRDSINAPLGIVVAHNAKLQTMNKFSSPQDPDIKKTPTTSVISPYGTILHGNNSPNQDKKLKLKIYYTETNN